MELIRKRNPQISIAKALGIILMVIGHVYTKDSIGIHFIYMFHMPLFFILSGYFFKGPNNFQDMRKYTYKKIKSLYLPFCKWVLLFILLHNFLLEYGIGHTKYSVSDIIFCTLKSIVSFVSTETILVGFWFIKALFTACIILAILFYIKTILKIHELAIPLILLFFISIQFFYGLNNLTIKGMMYGALFLYIGYIYHKYCKDGNKASWLIICICFLTILLLSQCYDDIHNTEMLLVDKTTLFPFTVTGTMGSIMILMISEKVCHVNVIIKNILCYIGNNTMIILALHYPIIHIWNYHIQQFIHSDSILNLTGCIIGITLPIALVLVYNFIRNKLVVNIIFNEVI